MLEPQVFRYRQNFDFFYYLGMSCLNTSDYGGGYSYLKRAIDLKPDDINTLAGLAIVHLKRHENSEALQHWFQILDLEPENRLAKKGLEILKKYSKQEDLIEYLESGKIINLLPQTKRIHPVIKVLFTTVVFLILISIFSLSIYNFFIKQEIKRPEIASVELNRFGSVVDDNDHSSYQFNDKEIRKLFETIRRFFDSYQDNLAMREINRLLLSNADYSTKEKVLHLASYITVPGFTTLKTNYTYQDFIKDQKLYENCYVHWKGRLSNLLISDKIISFDFLVGYDDEKVLEGIIPVTLDFGARIDSSFPIEVLGKIVTTSDGVKLDFDIKSKQNIKSKPNLKSIKSETPRPNLKLSLRCKTKT